MPESEGLQERDQRVLVRVAQHGFGPEGALIVAQSSLIVELRRAEVMAAIDHEVRTLAVREQRTTKVDEGFAELVVAGIGVQQQIGLEPHQQLTQVSQV